MDSNLVLGQAPMKATATITILKWEQIVPSTNEMSDTNKNARDDQYTEVGPHRPIYKSDLRSK